MTEATYTPLPLHGPLKRYVFGSLLLHRCRRSA